MNEPEAMKRKPPQQQRWGGILFVTATAMLFMLTLLLLSSAVDSFQLRDAKETGAGAAAATVVATGGAGGGVGKTRPSRTLFKDLPMRKIARIVKDVDNQASLENDNDGDSNADDDDDDEDNEDSGGASPEKVFVFEKHFDLPQRPAVKLSQPDVDQVEEEAKEEAESGEQVSAVLDPVWQLVDYFGLDWLPDTSGLLDWLLALRNKEDNAAGRSDSKEDVAADDDDAPGFWQYLILLKYLGKEHLLDRADRTTSASDEDNASAEKPPPLSVQHFENRLLAVPSFVPNYTNVENIECKRMGQIFQRQVRGEKLWALQMMDASAKVPTGLLRGNANQLGDFDQCLDIRMKVKLKEDKSVKIRGKYCLANVDVEATVDELRLPVHLLQGRNMLRSHLDDVSVGGGGRGKFNFHMNKGCAHGSGSTKLI